ncbi:hypothetical protein [Streptomyces sp. NPDC101393]|uniref:hypothetical protein n=1 Tax=Streptomyces sp. NPDC101393 TaxID=3366141 RepID=UPI0038245FB5
MAPLHALFNRPEPRRVLLGEFPLWDETLALLDRDLAVTLPEQEPLRLLAPPHDGADDPEHVCVALATGEWHGNVLSPESAAAPAHAVANIADAAQETLAECLRQAWPLCAEHDLGMHPRDAEGQLPWWRAGDRQRRGPAHLRAAVGALDTLGIPVPPRRPHRTRRRAD